MAALTPINATNLQPTAGTTFTFQAGSTSGDTFLGSRRMMLFAMNQHTNTAKTLTVISQPDHIGRTADITAQSLGAGEMAVGLFDSYGWLDSGNRLNLDVESTDIKWNLINLPK